MAGPVRPDPGRRELPIERVQQLQTGAGDQKGEPHGAGADHGQARRRLQADRAAGRGVHGPGEDLCPGRQLPVCVQSGIFTAYEDDREPVQREPDGIFDPSERCQLLLRVGPPDP